jgi:hypothetical protein
VRRINGISIAYGVNAMNPNLNIAHETEEVWVRAAYPTCWAESIFPGTARQTCSGNAVRLVRGGQ